MADREGRERRKMEAAGGEMSVHRLRQWRVYLVALVTIAELAHLAWEYFHGGVRTHHFLARSDMPAFSNWWGLLVLPALAWFAGGCVEKRIALKSAGDDAAVKLPASVIAGFVGGLLFGVLLSTSFMTGHDSISSALFQGMLLLALLLPVYRAECLLGFVLGMTFTFGAVLPTFIGSVIAAISAFVHLLVYPLFVRGWKCLKRT
jgi:hypothetical protein